MNSNSIALISRIVLITLMVVGVVLWILILTGGDDSVTPMITWAYIAFFAAIALAILSTVFSIAINPSSLKSAAIGIIIVAVIAGLSYVLADGAVLPSYKGRVDESTSKLVSTGLNAFYIVGLLAVLSVVYSGVARIFK